MADETRGSILDAISDWLKLLGLVVLVAEAVIIIAMKFTPETNPLVRWYPVLMLLFLLVIVVGVFWDRYTQSKMKTQTLAIGETQISVETSQITKTTQQAMRYDVETMYVDTPNGFMFARPKLPKWSEPQHLSLGEMLVKTGLLPDLENWEEIKETQALLPLGKMKVNTKFVVFEYDTPVQAQLTDETSNKVLDTFIDDWVALAKKDGEEVTAEEIKKVRKTAIEASGTPESFPVQNKFFVGIMDKSLVKTSPLAPNLGNVFLIMNKYEGAPVDRLVASEESILWGTRQTYNNVLVNGKPSDLTGYQYHQLLESPTHFYHIGIYFSPQTDSSIDVWEELQGMIKSFRVIV